MRALLAIFTVFGAFAQPPAPAPLVYAGKPLQIDSTCTDDDMQMFGLACTTEEPCPVYLELSSLDTGASRILIAGNFHTETATLSTILLASEDGGTTWTGGGHFGRVDRRRAGTCRVTGGRVEALTL